MEKSLGRRPFSPRQIYILHPRPFFALADGSSYPREIARRRRWKNPSGLKKPAGNETPARFWIQCVRNVGQSRDCTSGLGPGAIYYALGKLIENFSTRPWAVFAARNARLFFRLIGIMAGLSLYPRREIDNEI